MKEEKLLKYVTRCRSDLISNINFICRMMISSALPYSKVNKNVYERVSGNSRLVISNMQEDIPYGVYPRIILSWLITEAVRTKSRMIYIGSSLSSFMKQLGLSVTGGKNGTINRFKQQLMGLITSNISYSFFNPKTKKNVILNFSIADSIYYSVDDEDVSEDFFDTKLVLSEPFFNEVIKYPIPVDKDALSVLRSSALALDIYFWLTYKMSYIKEKVEIPFSALKEQFGFSYGDTKQGRYEFRRKFVSQLNFVLSLYNLARITIDSDKVCLYPSAPHVRKIKYRMQNLLPEPYK